MTRQYNVSTSIPLDKVLEFGVFLPHVEFGCKNFVRVRFIIQDGMWHSDVSSIGDTLSLSVSTRVSNFVLPLIHMQVHRATIDSCLASRNVQSE
jgi:hypothetical protein